ncbi:hypothetical protein K432DRAFT_381301 [Lepidopterella palustris CBS 459.81]|uniref:SAP domain-containing protein n=1 Tax=Lepidopterella palustris CBS 459.81 TaxID=1314670 RepID=A0A8E2ECH1_9PEZI|nr:hypothetical protein K432DRAFT_381301 [Lepidopterella palustris CBS 459.81]
MAASRASSLRALNQLAAGSKQQARKLHMTGPATFSSLLTTERPAVNLPRDLAGLRAECKKRNLPVTGSKAELTDRLSAHEVVNSRAFSTAMQDSKRPSTQQAEASVTPIRHFNTNRALKAVNDSSTIDFAYLPDFDPDNADAGPIMRMPLLPQSFVSSPTSSYAAEEEESAVMRPTIMTVSADSTHISSPSAMSEVSDNSAIDFQGMAEKVSAAAQKFSRVPIEEKTGMVKEVWGGLLDDIFGPKQPAKA